MTSHPTPIPREQLTELARQQRIQSGIEVACSIARLARRQEFEEVHRITAECSHDALRQLVATLAAMAPADVDPRNTLAYLTR